MEEITNSFDNEGSIDIMTDARHGHRKNAKDTNVMSMHISAGLSKFSFFIQNFHETFTKEF